MLTEAEKIHLAINMPDEMLLTEFRRNPSGYRDEVSRRAWGGSLACMRAMDTEMSTLAVNDDVQVEGYAPSPRMVEDITACDLTRPFMWKGEMFIPWMSDSGCRFFAAHHRLFNLRYFARIGR